MGSQTAVWLVLAALAQTEGERLFRERVAPLLERRCVHCHNDVERKGGLSLQTAAQIQLGGDSGVAIVPRQPDDSPLLANVVGDPPAMPQKSKPLSAQDVEALRAWIAAGAPWPNDVTLQERPEADADWWSLQPVARPQLPAVDPRDAAFVRTPIDQFVAARLRAEGLSPSTEADRRTLIRRLSFDLRGLPPSPAEVADFAADAAPDAYERLVERYLASPHYGERWARHWLDVVHYGDTHGYDKDKLRPNAWPYRDYVIRALNADKPYAQFVAEQLAGDVAYPDTVDGVTALGFIAAGPWDFISHVEVPESKTDGKIARSLDRDDMVVNALNTFCSTTVQCARCHAHKFDPISQEDYYRLQAVFAALDRADRTYDLDPQIGRRRSQLLAQQRAANDRQKRIAAEMERHGGPALADLTRRIGDLERRTAQGLQVPPEYGYHSQIEPTADRTKWVQVDLGAPVEIARLVVVPCHDTFNNIGAGFGFPLRYKLEVSDDPEFRQGVTVVADRTATDVPNPGIAPQASEVGGKAGRYVRLTATRLALRANDYIFAVSELQVWTAAGANVALQKPVTSLDSIEAAPRWRRANLVDGLFPTADAGATTDQLATLRREREALRQERIPAELLSEAAAVERELAAVREALGQLPPAQLVYAGTVHYGDGNFVGTGPFGGKPRPVHILARGDVRKPGVEVGPGAPPFVPGLPAAFELPPDHSEGARRAALAAWITHRDNPLTWRSIVNRVWQYHFGRGLVDSPNDFGRMGQRPSHPEVLDWLAAEFRDGDQSLKRLHRLIVTSGTYRQSSSDRADYARRDAQNVLLWRANRRKLDAEAVRDSLLLVSDRLDTRMGGPGFQDFVIEQPAHSPHYEYHLHDPEDPRAHRRSVYRFLVRSQPQPFMTTLDCADPSMLVDKRNETINALQALAILNNGLSVVLARHFAARAAEEAPTLPAQVGRAFELALSRPPTPEELRPLVDYAQQHGLANCCRVIVNLNEFAFVD